LMPLKKSMTSGNILEDANGNPVPADAVAEGHGLVGRLGGRPVLAIRKNGQVLGFSAVCTHLGCIVRWNESSNRIECPCHGGKFDLQGNITGGPPPEALDALTLRIEGNRILRG
ncbi:MAG: Rieske 2Fe-2S domain-containing protein, partial [bacterium]|nr:Rieske 2Fe-2S domain-containing protein [bacterium]